MEQWTFPPRFDADYLPPRQSRYWFPQRETMPAGARDQAIVERLRQLTRYAWDTSPFYRRKWDAAGFHPDHLRSLEDFEAKVPVITKQDLRDAQAATPPFGDYLCVADRDVHAFRVVDGDRDLTDRVLQGHRGCEGGAAIRAGEHVKFPVFKAPLPLRVVTLCGKVQSSGRREGHGEPV